MPDATVRLQPRGPMTGVGVGPDAPREHPPRIGVPERALDCPASAKTGPDGSAEVTLAASDPGHPRRGIDGQVYLVDYRLGGRQENAVRHPFDCIAVHVRDHFDPPKNPSWEHVGPILTRYARLYPVMKTLVDLADPGDIARHKQRLLLALELDLSDPNFMPVTRDLSDAKRKTIVRWLKQLRPTDPTPAPAGPAPAEAVVEPTASADPGSKTRFADTFLRRPPAP